MHYVYLLRCENGHLYTGYTNNIERRIKAHCRGKGAKYTRANKPIALVYLALFSTKSEALKREMAIKRKTKEKKEKMITKKYDWEQEANLASNDDITAMMSDRNEYIGLRLVEWYQKNKRVLLWRDPIIPYRIWVSEIMAQQTRITTVIPYFERFMEKFPTVFDLALAEEEDVLKKWEGLGYYSRARNLHKAAREIVQKYDGEIPDNYHELKTLSGIGDYTAGAIASIAFNQAVPAVDGNVLRVCTRVESWKDDIAIPSTKRKVAQCVQQWIPVNEASDFTQALMELGALICQPTQIQCDECPIQKVCLSNKNGNALDLPIKSIGAKPKVILRTVLLLSNQHGEWFLQRRGKGLLQGLWEFPGWDQKEDGMLFLKKELKKWHINDPKIQEIGPSKHVFSHLIWQMRGFFVQIDEIPDNMPEGEWVSNLDEKTLPTALKYYRTWAMEQ